jgi:hypothetical protein
MSPKAFVLKDLFIRSGFIGLLIPLAFAIQVSAADKSLTSPPNILLIMGDDMGYTDIGSFEVWGWGRTAVTIYNNW